MSHTRKLEAQQYDRCFFRETDVKKVKEKELLRP
jgi:hypothetical protein